MDVGKATEVAYLWILNSRALCIMNHLDTKITFNPGHSLKASPAFALAPCDMCPTRTPTRLSPSRLHLGDGRPTQEFQLRAHVFTYGTKRKGVVLIRARKLKVKQVVQHPRRHLFGSWKAKCLLIITEDFLNAAFRYCLSLSPRWIGNKQILNHISTFAMWFFAILGCNLGNITSMEHCYTILHLHFYHFLDWKATLRDQSSCLSGFGVVNGIQSLALHTARASSCERSLPSDSLLWHKPYTSTMDIW